MPLHLLGKKSWNVYNPANIERVRRDEAAAKAREEAEEQRQQDADAARRLALLRGEVPPPLPPPSTAADDVAATAVADREKRDRGDEWGGGQQRKKRKRFGEDDTDFEMRVARERTAGGPGVVATPSSDAPLVDRRGHIDLFPREELQPPKSQQKNEEAEREAASKRREYEDQYTMRFSNAVGKDGLLAAGPWYAKGGGATEAGALDEAPGRDVWGNEDPRRKQREAARVVASDPLAAMKRGAAKMREVERERKLVNEERARELKLLRREERRREKRRRRKGGEDDDVGLEGFSLDDAAAENRSDRKRRGRDDDDGDHRRRRHRESRGGDERDRHHSGHRHHHRHHHDSQGRSSRTEHRNGDRG
ncbi:hypothetical protein F4779DRAFT_519761 [Xylariaceae sp. FL0662B]|nr:hypothetical protein F4779DRAFT_519761 [Xylariaceae sp. FL0662B]